MWVWSCHYCYHMPETLVLQLPWQESWVKCINCLLFLCCFICLILEFLFWNKNYAISVNFKIYWNFILRKSCLFYFCIISEIWRWKLRILRKNKLRHIDYHYSPVYPVPHNLQIWDCFRDQAQARQVLHSVSFNIKAVLITISTFHHNIVVYLKHLNCLKMQIKVHNILS